MYSILCKENVFFVMKLNTNADLYIKTKWNTLVLNFSQYYWVQSESICSLYTVLGWLINSKHWSLIMSIKPSSSDSRYWTATSVLRGRLHDSYAGFVIFPLSNFINWKRIIEWYNSAIMCLSYIPLLVYFPPHISKWSNDFRNILFMVYH